MRTLARVMVFTTAVLLFVAMIVAHDVLSHGSGTYFATFMFVPFAIGPGILVWFRPGARYLGLWAGSSAFASLIYLVGGEPLKFERELAGWPVIETSMYAAMLVSVVGATILAWAHAAYDREPGPDSPRARRIRGIAKLAPIVAVTALVFEIPAVHHDVANTTLVIAAMLGLTVAPAAYVHRRGTRRMAIVWSAWSLPFTGPMLWAMVFSDERMPLFLRMFMMSAGTLAALLLVVLPLSAVFASDERAIPEAREL